MCLTQKLNMASILFMRRSKENTLEPVIQSHSIGSQRSRQSLVTSPRSALMSGSLTINLRGNSLRPDPDLRELILLLIRVVAPIIKKQVCARLSTSITENQLMSSQLNSEWAKRLGSKLCTNRETGQPCIPSVIRYTRHLSINLTSSKMVDSLSDQRILFYLPLFLGTKEKLREVEIQRSLTSMLEFSLIKGP